MLRRLHIDLCWYHRVDYRQCYRINDDISLSSGNDIIISVKAPGILSKKIAWSSFSNFVHIQNGFVILKIRPSPSLYTAGLWSHWSRRLPIHNDYFNTHRLFTNIRPLKTRHDFEIISKKFHHHHILHQNWKTTAAPIEKKTSLASKRQTDWTHLIALCCTSILENQISEWLTLSYKLSPLHRVWTICQNWQNIRPSLARDVIDGEYAGTEEI
jgi:hypothetical protein